MATLVNNPGAVSSMAEMLGRMNISPQDLQAANETPLAHALATLIDNVHIVPSDLQDFLIQPNTYKSPETQLFSGGNGRMLDIYDYRLPSEFEIDPLLNFPDHLSTFSTHDLSAHHVDDLSMQLDGMTIDDIGSGSSFISPPEPPDNRGSATSFGNTNPAYSTYAISSLSPPAPSFDDFLEEAGIDIDQYEEFARIYSPDVNWQDMPLNSREYEMQEIYLAQVEDICNETDGIRMAQESSGGMSLNALPVFGVTVAQDQFDSRKPFIAATEDHRLMPLGNLICIDSLTGGGRGEEVESALWAPTS